MVYVAPLLYSTMLIVTYIYIGIIPKLHPQYHEKTYPYIILSRYVVLISHMYIINIINTYYPYISLYHIASLSLSICLPACLSVCLSLSIYLSIDRSIYLYLSISVYRSIDLSVCMFLYIPTWSPSSTHQTTVFSWIAKRSDPQEGGDFACFGPLFD
jgi:hypothetical protein